MAPVCHIVYLGLSNQLLSQCGRKVSNFLKNVKKKERLLPRDLPRVYVLGPPLAHEDGEEKIDMTPVALGIRMP